MSRLNNDELHPRRNKFLKVKKRRDCNVKIFFLKLSWSLRIFSNTFPIALWSLVTLKCLLSQILSYKNSLTPIVTTNHHLRYQTPLNLRYQDLSLLRNFVSLIFNETVWKWSHREKGHFDDVAVGVQSIIDGKIFSWCFWKQRHFGASLLRFLIY